MPTVHVVDDNFTVRESVGLILADAAYSVRDYASTEAFLQRIEADEPGCVIADLHMPEISGLEMLENLQQTGVALPAIMMTGDDSLENIVLAMKRGAIDFIFKPFTSEALLSTVRSALEQADGPSAKKESAEFCREKLVALFPEEEAALAGVLEGQSLENIAAELGLIGRDVRLLLANLNVKMGAKNLPDLVRKSLLGASAR